jgi:uncharacterized SAM-binding protein YcdF (DUF218 family)
MYRFFVDLLQPPVFFYLFMLLGVANLWRKRQETKRRLLLVTIPLIGLTLCCIPALNFVALGSLEWAYPPLEERPADVQAIVVLAGDIRPADTIRKKPELGGDTLERCLKAAEVYHQGKPCPIVVSGGKADPDEPGPAPAPVMRDFLLKMGVKPGDLIVESTSRTTYENAVESCKLLEQRGIGKIILVSDSTHLGRALACFRKQGMDAVPCGCRYRATKFGLSLFELLPNPASARSWEMAWHEWLGSLWYWMHGRT